MASEQGSGMALGIIYRTVRCDKCGHPWPVNTYLWEARCPECNNKMVRKGGEVYCYCSHQLKIHSRPDCGGCYECECMRFVDVKDYVPDEYDVEYFKRKTCRHKFPDSGIVEGKVIKYQCIYCGYIQYSNTPE